MSLRPRRPIITLFLTTLLAGCDAFSPPEAVFVLRPDTEDLESDVLRGVEESMEANFGTPHDLVAWQKLPVEFGGVAGTTAAPSKSGPVRTLDVAFEEEAFAAFEKAYVTETGRFSFPPDGLLLSWTSGPDSGKSIVVTGYDPEAKTLSLADPIDPVPAEGIEFVLAGGENLVEGRRLYMTHCMHCHGVSGDGAGPTAPYLNPLPRDYRLGLFKFKSTLSDQKVSREDLSRVVKYGIPGTYMPSFLLMKDDELKMIVEYVRWLAMRGELEYSVVLNELKLDYSRQAIRERTSGPDGESREAIEEEITALVKEIPVKFDEYGNDLSEIWAVADEPDSQIVPAEPRVEDSLESRMRGRKFFLEKCATCHGHTGRGDGQMTLDFQKNTEDPSGANYPVPGLHDVWGNQVKPRNLTQGIFRGGRRPIDLYYRLYGGITASKMPAFNTAEPVTLWDTINYVLHIPFETAEDKAAYKKVDAEYEAQLKATPATAETPADPAATTPAAEGATPAEPAASEQK